MVFFVLSLAAYLIQNFSNKTFALKHGSKLSTLQNEICVIGASFVLMLCGYATILPQLGMILAVVYGIVYFLAIFCLLRAMSYGSLGLSTIICNMGNLIPVVFGVIVFNDDFNAFTFVGIVLMIATLILTAPSSKKKTKSGYGWFVFALCSALCNGILGVLKLYVTKNLPDVSSGNFLFWAFTFAAVTGIILIIIEITRGLPAKLCFEKFASKSLIGLGAGFGTALGNLFFLMALESDISSAILFPLNTSMLSILLWLMSWLVFRDVKPTIKNIFALVICILGVIFINIK